MPEKRTSKYNLANFKNSKELDETEKDFVLVDENSSEPGNIEKIENPEDQNIVEVLLSPKNSFTTPKRKVSFNHSNNADETENIPISDKVGRKDYYGGKLKFDKLKQNLFQGGLGSIQKSLFKTLGFLLLVSVLIGVVGVSYILYLYQTIDFNDTQTQSKSTVILAADGKTELFKIYGTEGKRQEATWEEIPDNVKLAFLALEDENYYYYDSGISWYNLGGAILNCATSLGNNCRGGSSISQQVVRKISKDETRDKTEVVQRKLREIVRAYKLNLKLNKEEILLKYLNLVPMGRNNLGVKEAAKSYFGKEIKDVDVVEACYMATFPPSPTNYAKSVVDDVKNEQGEYVNPWRQTMERRKNACIQKLSEKPISGPGSEIFLPADQVKALQDKEIKFQDDQNIYKYPHFVEYVRDELKRIFTSDIKKASPDISDAEADDQAEKLILSGGYKVVTTIDPEMQDKVQNVIRNQAKENIFKYNANNSSAVVIDNPTGEILAMVGSIAYNKEDLATIDGVKDADKLYEEVKGKVNVATSPQQPGSSFKPYTYATAFARGLFNPSTVLMDVKTAFDNDGKPYSPENFTKKFSGPVSIRFSMANSLNVPAVKAVYLSAGDSQNNNISRIKNTGINNVVATAQNMGLDFQTNNPAQCGPQIALGGCDVTLISHAEGMSTFARMGDKIPVSPFKQICNSYGEDIYNGKMCDGTEKAGIRKLKDEFYKKEDKVIDPKIAYEIIDIMTDVEARTAVFGTTRCILTLNNCNKDKQFKDWQVAAKTGTSSDNRDTWTVGFTPQRTAVVWVGRTDNKEMTDSSMRTVAPIWQNIMKAAVEKTEKQDFKRPEDMVEVRVSPNSGLISTEDNAISQWMTEEQRAKLQEASDLREKTAITSDDLKSKDIFALRTTVFSRNIEINKLDQKLVTDENRARIAPENIEKKLFSCPVSEFPWAKAKNNSNWQEGVDAYFSGNNLNTGCGPTELSNTFRSDTTTDDKKPILNIQGINDGWFYNSYPLRIEVTATTPVFGNTVTDTQIFVNGEEKSSAKSNFSSYTIGQPPSELQTMTVFFKANDNSGNSVTSPIYTINLLPAGTPLPADSNKAPGQPSASVITINTPAPLPDTAGVKFEDPKTGATLTGTKDLLVSSLVQLNDPKFEFTKLRDGSKIQFAAKELNLNGYKYRASFDFNSFEPGDYLIKLVAKKQSDNAAVQSDEIAVKLIKI